MDLTIDPLPLVDAHSLFRFLFVLCRFIFILFVSFFWRRRGACRSPARLSIVVWLLFVCHVPVLR